MKNIELSACEEMIMTIIWNNEAELDLAAVMTQTNERYHTAWKPQTVSTFLQELRKRLSGFLSERTLLLLSTTCEQRGIPQNEASRPVDPVL